jgi:hypothetical protein
MKKWIGPLLLIVAFGCQTSRPTLTIDAIPTPLAQRAGTELPAETEKKLEIPVPAVRFPLEENFVGKTEEEVKDLLGSPKSEMERSCKVGVQENTAVEITMYGTQWYYEAENENYSANTYMCVFRGKVVSTLQESKFVVDKKIIEQTRKIVDHVLIRQQLRNKTKTDEDLFIEQETKNSPKKDL